MKKNFEIEEKYLKFKMANKALYFEAYMSGKSRIVGYILKFSNRRDIKRFLENYYKGALMIVLSEEAPEDCADPQEWVEILQKPYSREEGWMDGRASIREFYEDGGYLSPEGQWIWSNNGSSGRQPVIQRYW